MDGAFTRRNRKICKTMTSPNPTSSEIDALVLAKVKEVVPEIECEECGCSGIITTAYNGHRTCGKCDGKGTRPIQLADILQILDYTRCIVTCDRGYFRITPYVIGRGSKTRKTIDWNLSLDWAHQDEKTKLEIWKLIK